MVVFTKDVHYLENHSIILNDPKKITEIRKSIENGDVFIVRSVVSKEQILKIREYLTQIGKSSLPNYKRIEKDCSNFHRVNIWDKRSYVLGCFHQFSFFPWNQDLFDLFKIAKEVYFMRNLINNLPKNSFVGVEPENECIARLSFQFYPKGIGGLNKHSDPVDFHQLTAPALTMSAKGKDFMTGGAYIEKQDGKKIMLDEISEIGDVIYYNAQIPHGVEKIDPDSEVDWLSFEGRWVLLFAVNKLHDNNSISNAIDFEKSNGGVKKI